MRKPILATLALLAAAVAAWGWIKEQPIHRTPAPDWEASITLPGVAAVPFTVPVAGATLEALMLKPEASGPVGAVVFAGGSGDGLF